MVIDNIIHVSSAQVDVTPEKTKQPLPYHPRKNKNTEQNTETTLDSKKEEPHNEQKEKNPPKRIILQGDTIGKPKEQKYELESLTFIPPALVFSYDKGLVVRNFYNEMTIRNIQQKANSIYSAPTSRKLLTLHEAAKEDIGFLWN